MFIIKSNVITKLEGSRFQEVDQVFFSEKNRSSRYDTRPGFPRDAPVWHGCFVWCYWVVGLHFWRIELPKDIVYTYTFEIG